MNGIPSRKEWQVIVPASDKQMTIEHHTVFGWKVRRHLMPTGATIFTQVTIDIPKAKAPNRAMYVAGRCNVYHNDVQQADREAGTYLQDVPVLFAGMHKVVAVEPSEFWCFNYSENRRSLPRVTPVRILAGQTYTPEQNELLFVMKGSLNEQLGPFTLEATQGEVLTAQTNVYAFKIEEAKQ